jgi:hypothetical protein
METVHTAIPALEMAFANRKACCSIPTGEHGIARKAFAGG